MGMLFHDQAWMKALVSPAVFLGLPAVWVIGVFALVQVMMTKTAVQVKTLMQIYNVVQIVVCGYMVIGLFPVLGLPNFFGVNSEFDKQGEWFVFVHYLSKYLDWFDTLWIILNKKRAQLSFLHLYHHCTIVSVWGLLLDSGVGVGTIRYGAFINSLTHVIMYSHYLWTSFGLKNPFKAYITMWQITQFYSCLVHAFIVLFYETTPVRGYAWIQVLYQMTMVYLFSNKLHYVPPCIPDFSAKKGEPTMSVYNFCNPQDSDEAPQTQAAVEWKTRYVVIRDKAYDVSKFNHPGGFHMIDTGVGRDATVMFECSHARLEYAEKVLATLPNYPREEIEAKGYNFGRKETVPTPSQSKLYETIRKRVVKEVLEPAGYCTGKNSSRGVPAWHILSVVGTWLVCATWFVLRPSVVAALFLGFALAWVGTGVQHTANHGGLWKNTTLNYLTGLLDDIATGGSSIVWRYHHQVGHHAYCNDLALDPDTYSSFPLVRLDSSQQWQPYHRFQFIYAPISFCFLWFSIQFQDLQCLLDSTFFDISFKGTSSVEITLAIVLKAIHFSWIVILPYQLHGFDTMLYPWIAVFGFGGFALASQFIVSHNVDETKFFADPSNVEKDWARRQIETSTSWGGEIGSFFSGGLNLQIEHHLFPCMAHSFYGRAQVVVKDECAKQGVPYTAYNYLLPNFVDHIKFLYHMGQDPSASQVEAKKEN
jgi:fatty acid desaturase (delta-4 desaturase)